MLKDLLLTLQDGIAQSQDRRAASAEAMTPMLMGGNSPVGAPQGNGGGGKGERAPGKWGDAADSSVDDTLAALNKKGIPLGVSGGRSSGKLGAFLKSVAAQESGGNYKAVGVPTKYGTAYGKYQILDANFVNPGGWDKEALGRDINIKQYLNSPKIQEKIAQSKLSQYFKQYGAGGAAKAWYAGPGNANTNSDSSQYGGPSINDYAAQVLARMKKYM